MNVDCPTDDFKQAKAQEESLGFVCFKLKVPGIPGRIDGIVNISQSLKSGGSGQIAMAFLFDAGRGRDLRQDLEHLFARLDFSGLIGRRAQTVVRTKVEFDLNPAFALEEVTFYFSQLEGRQTRLVEKTILPGFTERLGITFQPIFWFPRGDRPRGGKQTKFKSLIARFTAKSSCKSI